MSALCWRDKAVRPRYGCHVPVPKLSVVKEWRVVIRLSTHSSVGTKFERVKHQHNATYAPSEVAEGATSSRHPAHLFARLCSNSGLKTRSVLVEPWPITVQSDLLP